MDTKKIFMLTLSLGLVSGVFAQSKKQQTCLPAQLQYQLVVYENPDGGTTFDESVNSERGILGDMWKQIRQQYATTLSGQVSNTSANILATGVGLLVDKLRSHKKDWQLQVMKDCKFSKSIPMSQEIANFYATTSDKGANDPQKMLFNGFGCQQFYDVKVMEDGRPTTKRILGLDMKCSLKKDSLGMIRMLHHGKFEVVLDYFYFNPYLCSLPNDSLQSDDMHLRTAFDFRRRKNLQFEITADVTSSWMNEAIQIVEDKKIGEFKIKVCIPDSSVLETDGTFKGCFVYIRPDSTLMSGYGWEWNEENRNKMKAKNVAVTGESFLVPRSFIGTADGKAYKRIWGTGQYKINMNLSVKCDINFPFYYDDNEQDMQIAENNILSHISGMQPPTSGKKKHRWNRYWSEEWKRIKERRKSQGFFTDIWNDIKVNYTGNRWVYTLLEPVENAILTQESNFVNEKLNDWFNLGTAVSQGQAAVSQQQDISTSSNGTATAGQTGASSGSTPTPPTPPSAGIR